MLRALDAQWARWDGWVQRHLPAEDNPWAQTGRLANWSLVLAVFSGIALLIWYRSSLHQAHDSLAVLAASGRSLGGWVRALHRYSSDLAMLFIALHALRMLTALKFTGARWLPWVSGVGMIVMVWFIGWTGYWLVWDQPARQIAVTSMGFLDALPIFGEPLGRLFLTDRLVPSLLFFVVFFLHMLLPLLIAVGLAAHLVRLTRVKLLPDRRLKIALVVALGIAAWMVPAPLDPPARMAERPEVLTVDAWYLSPLALASRFEKGGLWLAIAGVGLLGAGVPWLLGRRFAPRRQDEGPRPSALFQTTVEIGRCHACTQCEQDCPYDAVHMVPRTDGKPWDHQAWVDPTRCVGCGVCVGSCDSEAMHLPWFDAVAEEPAIQAVTQAALTQGTGPVRVALVAWDAVGGVQRFDESAWRRTLPGYQVHGVPTAAWVRPKFVERLLAGGIERVLVVRDGRGESAARDGNRWAEQRLMGERKPAFRPQRAGGHDDAIRVFDFTPGGEAGLQQRVAAWSAAGDGASTFSTARSWRGAVVLAGVLGLLLALTVGGSHLRVTNPEGVAPELVLSFKAFGPRETAATERSAEELAKLPVHMRGASVGKPHRLPVEVTLTVDGEANTRTYDAKGISRDGPAIDVWRVNLELGAHVVEIRLRDEAGEQRWQGTVEARERHLNVITYEPTEGFRLE
ncbi:cytochrome b N-terminal domain-containing protein [Actomonas aquatica]|uniref:Cytochrome b N-terminal domain-containing protein n=1 Tax=Actomonas aquatica TaxID=2866162 RepID=A0ABZ1C582_9BACT|nr:cytochrome b N-terminal domain-containing protein [Opitutus sp. WL0086]WRQ86552.1 cytochrome b N-terminal domain-containing protein [Opitutus sp. WL0086]